VGARLVRELQGWPCAGVVVEDEARKSLASTRSFGQPLTEWTDVAGAVASHAARAGEKLRRQGLAARLLTVVVETNRFGGGPPPYSYAAQLTLAGATADTLALAGAARRGLERLWRPGLRYVKAGVLLDGLERAGGPAQGGLFGAALPPPERAGLMRALDALNGRYGAGAVRVAAAAAGPGQAVAWEMRRGAKSPAFTPKWGELWGVRC